MTADVRALKVSIGRWSREVHGTALDDMPDRMRPYAPIGTQVPRGRAPGQLRKSIRRDRAAVGFSVTRVTGRIIAPVIQAETTEKGSPPHVIRPRRAGGLLVFYWPKIGKVIGLRYVNHPGNQPKPWWKRALQATYGPALRYAAIRTPLR